MRTISVHVYSLFIKVLLSSRFFFVHPLFSNSIKWLLSSSSPLSVSFAQNFAWHIQVENANQNELRRNSPGTIRPIFNTILQTIHSNFYEIRFLFYLVATSSFAVIELSDTVFETNFENWECERERMKKCQNYRNTCGYVPLRRIKMRRETKWLRNVSRRTKRTQSTYQKNAR